MNAIKAILYYFSIVVAIVFLGLPYAYFHCYRKRDWSDYTRICCSFFSWLFPKFGIELEVEGKENIPIKDGFVIVSNHQSFLDINVIFAAVSHTAFVAKSTLWKVPYFGWVLNRTGSIPIYRSDPKKNAGLGKKIAERTAKGYNFCVFPEGKRAGDGVMFRFQNGIFRVAKKHPVKILPITLIGTGKCLPKTKLGLFPGKVKVVIHPVLEPEDYAMKTMEELRDSVHDIVESALPYASGELLAQMKNS